MSSLLHDKDELGQPIKDDQTSTNEMSDIATFALWPI